MGKKLLAITVITVLLTGTACLFSPKNSNNDGVTGYYSPADSAWKVLHNLQLAYQQKDIDEYMDCLHPEFEFILLEVDWDDYDGDGLEDESWGRDLEELYTTNMFSSPQADVIELTLNGDTESVWYGDTTGTTMQLQRSFDLKVYYYNAQGTQDGYHALGNAIFLCKPDESGEYKVWQWTDLSEV